MIKKRKLHVRCHMSVDDRENRNIKKEDYISVFAVIIMFVLSIGFVRLGIDMKTNVKPVYRLYCPKERKSYDYVKTK